MSVGGRLPGRLALTSPAPFGREARDRLDPFLFLFFFLPAPFEREIEASFLSPPIAAMAKTKQKITADGGSLGSRVDEERSQLRESM